MKKLIISILTCLLLIGTCFFFTADNVSANQDSDYNYTVNSKGEANITGYTGAGGAIIIPSTLGGYPTMVIGNNAFAYYSSITSVTIPNSVTTIGNNAFYYCTSMNSLTIPNSVITIGSSAFAHCTSLTSLTIPNSITIIDDSAFYDCKNLTSLILPDNIITIGSSAFYDCTNLTSVNIPDKITAISSNLFHSCKKLTSVTIPDNVTIIKEKAFWGCSSMPSIIIGKSVNIIESYVFYQCVSLKSITFLGEIAPISVNINWIWGTSEEIRGHAYNNSKFPNPGDDFYGLIMGTMLVSENEPPIADFTWMPSNPAQNQVVLFNASLSYDPDGSINLFEWDWNNDGIFGESYNYSTVKHKWTKTGNYPIVLRVTDNDGVKSTKTINISVSAGDKTPGFEIILMLVGFIFILYWKRKKY